MRRMARLGSLADAVRGVWRRPSQGDSSAPQPGAPTFAWRGYEIPLDLVLKTGGGPERFDDVVDIHARQMAEFAPVERHSSVLEIGCGIGRDAIPLTEVLTPPGRYIGIDIIEPSIAWCTREITARHPHFRFVHFDVHDDLHNPGGTITTPEVRFPVDHGSVDRAFAHSVFTHMFEDEIVHYLRELRRVLGSGSTAMMSMFLTDDHIRSSPIAPTAAIGISDAWAPGCWVHDPHRPRAAVAFDRPALDRMSTAAGLPIRAVHEGNLSGLSPEPHPLCGQDVVIFEAP